MEAKEVEAIVKASIGNNTKNKFGWDFSKCLVSPPYLIEVKDTAGKPWEMWLVFKEKDDGTGYSIIFDPSDHSYEIVTSNIMVSCHQNLMDTINAL